MLKKLWLIFSQVVTVCAGVAAAAGLWRLYAPDSPAPVQAPRDAVLSYSSAVKKAAPSVVNIYTREDPEDSEPESGKAGAPLDETPIGSGVIVSRTGYILTNSHVVEGLEDIAVALYDGRKSPAKLVGTDPDTDLALLKVGGAGFPAIEFGDSAALEVGDVVLAIGNPFNVGQTVTQGIVSALGRHSLGLNSFENFIQTDAAINTGNSGGALINTAGQLVGINTAIFSPDRDSGSSVGIGFAIPTALINEVLPALMRDGRVRRSFFGLVPEDLTAENSEEFGAEPGGGVAVSSVREGAAAWAGGIRAGDVITAINGERVADVASMHRLVSSVPPGSTVDVSFTRQGKKWRTKVTLQSRPPAGRP